MGHVIGIDTTYTGNPVSFNAAQGGTMKSIVVPFTYTQDLHGYANPWPGGGGVNQWDEEWERGTIGLKTGAKVDDNTKIRSKNYVPISPNTAYYYKFPGNWRMVYYDSDKNVVEQGNTYSPNIILTSPATAHYLLFALDATTEYDNNIAINYPATVTTYSPYSNICPISGRTGLSVYVSPTQDPDDATVYNVDWSAQAGTVYHGTVDPVTGQLTVDWVMYTFDGSEAWTASATPHRFSTNINYLPHPIATQPMTQGATQNVLTSVFGECVYTNADGVGYIVHQGGLSLFVVNESAATTVDDIKAIVTGMQFCYELATPLTYQLTPKQITALIGQNYIWSSNNKTLNTVLTAQSTGFAGWLIKCVTNGTPVEIPLKYMRAETYTVTPDQRMEWSAERDVTGVLHRETVQNLPPKIEFNTPLMTNSDITALNSIIKAAFTNYLQRNITIQFYDPERNQYWEWDCYMPDVKYHIRNADTVNNIINYEELRYAFIGY